jgi:prepilin-type N-terminal cleavage/methylation domain-containing protein
MGHRRLELPGRIGGRTEKGFTLLELMVVVTIILVLCTFSFFVYRTAIAHAKETVCKNNLDALHEALTLYLSENEIFPSSFSSLKYEHLEKGYAKALAKRGWTGRLCFFLIKMDASDHAYAQFLTHENLQKYGVAEKIFHCPSDPNGGISYGLNLNLAGKKCSEISGDVFMVADCDAHTFSSAEELTKRHRNKALLVRKDGRIAEVSDDRAVSLAELAVEELIPTPTDDVTAANKPEKDAVKPGPDPNWHAADKNKNR